MNHNAGSAETEGMVIHWAGFYDLIMRVVSLGREARFRRRMTDAAGLQAGQRVLDVGCGTGTVAVTAAQIVGDEGRVFAVDPAGEMIARARRKARRAGVDVEFEVGAVESLPYPDGCMDVVISTLVFHHLTRRLQSAAMTEIQRVLVAGGRLALVDFGGAKQVSRLAAEARAAGFDEITTTRLGPRFLFALVASLD
jgi:ubiquinone/menaquinone biosynthesis C-methylase UbiE